MGEFRKKPVVIEAVQYVGSESAESVFAFCPDVSREPGCDGDFLIHTPEGTMRASKGDWIIRGIKGEFYPCKPDIFAATYEPVVKSTSAPSILMAKMPTDNLSIGAALNYLRHGCRVQRASWNGKGQWIVLMPSLSLPPFNSQAPGAKVNDRTAKHIGPDTPLNSQPYFSLWTAQGLWQPGWNASTSDLLANDWQVVE